MKRVKSLTLLICCTLCGIVLLLSWFENSMIYPAPDRTLGDWKPSWLEFEEARFQSSDGTNLHGWLLEQKDARGTMLVCHGNGEHVSFMAEELDFLRRHFQVNVMAFDYRGYGKSNGKPSEFGVLDDAEAALSWLVSRTGTSPQKVILLGRSLGGAVAVHLAAENQPAALVLDRTFSSLPEVAQHHFPWLPVQWLMKNRYPSAQRITRYDGPLFQVHGKPDRVVPFPLGEKLFQASPSENKTFVAEENLGHNDGWTPSILSQLNTFLNPILAVHSSPDSLPDLTSDADAP